MASMFRFSVKSFRFNFSKPCYGSYRCVSQSQKQVNTDLEKSNHYDLIIAGGGLVGTALACGIAKTKVLSDLKVLLLEGAPPFKGFTGGPYKNRVSAINHGSVELFKSMEAWEQIFSTRSKSVKQMQIWDASSDAMISFNHDNFSDDVACIIENDLMLHAILEQLKLSKNVTLLNMATIDNVELRMNGSPKNVVTLKTGESITCDLLREQFIRLKESIASTIEKQYHMTMALIFPEKVQQAKSPNRVDFMCHRRSCSNIAAAGSLKNVIHSPPIKSPSKDSEISVSLKTTLPKIVVQRDSRISRSPRKTSSLSPNQSQNASAVEMSTDSPDDRDYHDSLATGQTSPNNSLLTINEEQSSGTDTRNETLTDATINSLLDAPCSTPYNNNKVASDVNQGTKDMRVLVQKLNIEQIMQISKNIFKSRTSKLNVSTDNLTQYNISKELQKDGSRNDAMNDITQTKLQENQNVQKNSKSVKRSKKTFKENIDSESESNYSGDESNVTNVSGKSLRPKRKGISFREPSLRKKLRNTTNMKL